MELTAASIFASDARERPRRDYGPREHHFPARSRADWDCLHGMASHERIELPLRRSVLSVRRGKSRRDRALPPPRRSDAPALLDEPSYPFADAVLDGLSKRYGLPPPW